MNTKIKIAAAFLLSLIAATGCSFDPAGLPAGPDAGADADADTGPIPCTTHAECEAAGLDCNNDRCMEGFCKAYTQCTDGLTCLAGTGDEADTCGTPAECDADLDCDDGSPCTDDYCVEGKCEPQSNCPSGQDCLEGVCRPPGAECVYDADCTPGLACEDVYCYDYTCEKYDGCDAGQVCMPSGSCQAPPQCDMDADCPDTDPSSCMVPDCSTAGTCGMVSDCPSGQICTSSGCITPGTAGVTLSATTVAATEGGSTGSYTVVLNSAPTSNVSISVSPNAQATVSASTLTFTPANWSTAQTVTVTAVNDAVVEGAHTGSIAHGAGSSDSAYNGISIAGVTVNVTDNDVGPSNPTIVCSLVMEGASLRTKATVAGPNIRLAFYDLDSHDPAAGCYLQVGHSESDSGASWPPYPLGSTDVSKPWVSDGSTYEFVLPGNVDEFNIASACPSGSPKYFDVTPDNSDGNGLRFAVSNVTNALGTATCQVQVGAGAISTDSEFVP